MVRRLVRKSAPEPEPEEEATQEDEWKQPTPLLYNVTDSCFILGKISKGTMYRLIQTNVLHPVKIGSRSLFTLEELERFVEERSQVG